MKKSKTGTSRVISLRLPLALFAAFIALSGCQTLQNDIPLPEPGNGGLVVYGGLLELEEVIIRLDGSGANRDDLANARRQADSLEGSADSPAFEAFLAAWSGRLFLMEGRTSDARWEEQRSHSLLPNNIPAQMLSFRLEQDIAKRLSLIDESLQTKSSSGELLAERGRALFDLSRFAESVAAFDSAFALLAEKPFYEEAYRVFHNKARELKDMRQGAANRAMDIARQEEITWRDLIEITRSETNLLRFITAGRDWPLEALFIQLLDRAFIPHTQDTRAAEWPVSRPPSSELVLRSGAAWFLWHLNAENRANRGLLTRYSSRFGSNLNARIPDLDIQSPFLDSILGCVESEFMPLPDGRNFIPHQRVRGQDFLDMLRRL